MNGEGRPLADECEIVEQEEVVTNVDCMDDNDQHNRHGGQHTCRRIVGDWLGSNLPSRKSKESEDHGCSDIMERSSAPETTPTLGAAATPIRVPATGIPANRRE